MAVRLVYRVALSLVLAWLCPGPVQALELSLEQAIDRALQKNYRHLDRMDEVTLAELDFGKVRSDFRTQLRASGNSNAINGAELGSYYGIGLSKDNVSGSRYAAGLYNSTYGNLSLSELRFSYTLPFFNRGKREENQLRIDRAQLGVTRRERMLLIAAEELAAEVTAAYYKVLLAQERRENLKAQRRLTEAGSLQASIRRDAGDISALLYEQAMLRLSRSEQSLLQAEFAQEQAEDRLKMLLALDVREPLQATSEIQAPDTLGLLELSVETLAEHALLQRPELVGQREELSLARRRIRSMNGRSLPDVDIDLQYALVGEGDRFENSLSFDDQRWGLGLRVDSDFGASERRSRRSRLYLKAQSIQRAVDALEQQVRVEVRSRHFDLQKSVRALTIAERAAELSAQTLEQAQLLADQGQLSATTLLENQLQYSEASYQTQSAKVDLALAAMALELAIGGIE